MDRTRKYHPEWGNPITKENTWYARTDKWILAQKLQITRIQLTAHMKLKKKEDQSLDTSILLEGGWKYPWKESQRQSVEQKLKECLSRDSPTWGSIPYYITKSRYFCGCQQVLPDRGCYSCLQRGSTSAWQIQTWILTSYHWTEQRIPNEGARERTQGTEGGGNHIGGTTIWTNH